MRASTCKALRTPSGSPAVPRTKPAPIDIDTKRLVVADLLAGYGVPAIARLRSLTRCQVMAIAWEVAGVVKPTRFKL